MNGSLCMGFIVLAGCVFWWAMEVRQRRRRQQNSRDWDYDE